jgi:hypothetical protein
MMKNQLLDDVLCGIIFLVFVVLLTWVPDFKLSAEDCAHQKPEAYVGSLCSELKPK